MHSSSATPRNRSSQMKIESFCICFHFFVGVCCSEVVEHRVFGKAALQEAKKLTLVERDTDKKCRKCSARENLYCIGANLLHDHCCCDRRHKEKFPFIPHVCYVKISAICEPVASDCEEYDRLYNCCCRIAATNQWKKFSANVLENKAEKSEILLGVLILSSMTSLNANDFSIKFR